MQKSYQIWLLPAGYLGLGILVLSGLSPIAAVGLMVYYAAIQNLWLEKQKLWFSLLLGGIGCGFDLGQFNLAALSRLVDTNLSLVKCQGWAGLWQIMINSMVNYKAQLIDNGLLGLIGIFIVSINLAELCVANLKENQQAMAEKTSSLNNDQVFLGVDSNLAKVFLGDKELNQHTLVLGTTGSGKTTTLMNFVASCCQRNLPLIYVDGKGSIKLAQRIQQLCIKYKRTLKVFTVDPHDEVPELATYNPLAFGNFTEWKNKIVTLTGEAETKGQEHYLIQEQSYINLVCEILNKSKRYMDFEGLLGYIKHPEELQKLANQIEPELALRLVKTGSNDKETADIVKILEVFYYSHYGHLFSTSKQPSKQIINLQQSLKQGEIVLFLLDGASLKRDTSLLGRLIINDINSAWAGFGRCGETIKGYCIFDEFAAYAAPNLANILAMQRDNGLHAVVGTQSLNAISMENSLVKRIAVELIANCNTYIIHKLNDPKDIELLIKTTGTHKGYEVTSSYAATNNHQWISTKVVDQSLIEPQAIRELSSGYGYVCRTVLKMQPQKVKFNFIG